MDMFNKYIFTYSRFIGEESYSKGQSRDYLIDENPTWCVDPLDGKFMFKFFAHLHHHL
jgi:hypothetical protein